MRAPVFAYGSYEALVAAVASGKVGYPTYCWVHDTEQYAFVNKQKEIELVGLPKLTGTLDSQIILSDLDDGVYEVKGQYKVTENAETVYLSASYIIVIVGSDGETKKVRRITSDEIDDFVVVNSEITASSEVVTDAYLREHGYATEGYVDDKIAALKVTIEEELKDYVDSIISEQIEELLPEEVDKVFAPVSEEDIEDMFSE